MHCDSRYPKTVLSINLSVEKLWLKVKTDADQIINAILALAAMLYPEDGQPPDYFASDRNRETWNLISNV
jgi:hypothetical protein